MKKIIKKILPFGVIQAIKRLVRFPDLALSYILKSGSFLSTFYYFLFNRRFDREHQAVLSGRSVYEERLRVIENSSVLLRRNVHRLEKGLIMQPRREVFAEDYIFETVQVYRRAMQGGGLDGSEEKWVTDVLFEYFNAVEQTETVRRSKEIFDQFVYPTGTGEKFIPYPHHNLPEIDIDFDGLHKLFRRRRSVRWYQDRPVPSELVEKAIDIVSLAPSACNRQPYFFYVSESKECAVRWAKCAGGTPGWAENIPCTIVVVGDLSAYPAEKDRHLVYIDGALASMQLMLALETLGLSSCPVNWPDIDSSERELGGLLKLKRYERPIMLISLGYARNDGGIAYSQKKNAQVLIKRVQID